MAKTSLLTDWSFTSAEAVERWQQAQERARTIRDDTVALIARAQTLRPTARSIRGGSDADGALVVTVLASSALCLDCIAKKTGIRELELDPLLGRIRGVVKITEESARCEACLRPTTVFRLG